MVRVRHNGEGGGVMVWLRTCIVCTYTNKPKVI